MKTVNKKDLEADLKKTEAALKDIRAKLEEIDRPKPTRVIYDEPSVGDKVWLLTVAGVKAEMSYNRGWKSALDQGNLFYDEASALHTGKVRAIRHRLAGFCAKAWSDAGRVIDWEDGGQVKYSSLWSFPDDSIEFNSRWHRKAGDFHLPTDDLTELKKQFTNAELKLAITGEL